MENKVDGLLKSNKGNFIGGALFGIGWVVILFIVKFGIKLIKFLGSKLIDVIETVKFCSREVEEGEIGDVIDYKD